MIWLLLAACTFPSSVPFRTLDYTIEDTRIVALNLPVHSLQGDTVVIDGLVLSPYPVDRVDVEICGLSDEMSVGIGAGCFENPDYIEPIGEGLPVVWQVPDLPEPTRLCLDEGAECSSRMPIRATAHTPDDVGYAVGQAEIWFRPPTEDDEEPPQYPTPSVTLEALDSPSAGGLVELVATSDQGWTIDFRWYVDAGELTETGRTLKQDFEVTSSVSYNAIVIPEDFHGPLQVSVVVAETTRWTQQPMGWDTILLEVP